MRFAALFCLCLLLAAGSSSAQTDAPAVRTAPFPKTHDNIHLEMVFNYDLVPSQLSKETGAVDLVWGSSWPTLPTGMYNTAYIPISVDNYLNPVSWYQTNHPDWLEYLCDKKTLAFEFGATTLAPLDFANSTVQAYQWSNWVDAPLAAGFQGIAVDTMDLTNDWQRCGHYDTGGTWVQQYTGQSDDPGFRHDVEGWEAATYQHVHAQSSTATMQVNVTFHFGEPLADNQKLMTTTDLLLDERGFTNWGVSPDLPTPVQWQGIVSLLRYVQSKGVCYMTNGEQSTLTTDIPQSARLWVIGNYLLVKNDCTYMYMSGTTSSGGQDYGKLVSFPEYKISIGHPTGAMTKTQGIWERAYSNGLTLVNPYNATATVTLPAGTWVDVNGNSVGSPVTLTQQTAQVLLLAK